MVVQHGGIDAIENFLRLFLFGTKGLEVGKYLVTHPAVLVVHDSTKINGLLEKHRIFTKEFELDFFVVSPLVVWVEMKMLHPKRAAPDRIGLFVRVLFTTDTKCQPIDDPRRRCQLFHFFVPRFEVCFIGLANLDNLLAQLGCLVVLESIRFPLEGRLRRQLHVFGLVVNVLLPRRQPLPAGVVTNVSPCVPGNVAPWNRGAFRQVEGDLFGCDSRFELSHLRMFSASPKGTWRFHVVVTDLLYVSVYLGKPILEHGLVPIVFVGLAFLVGNSFSDNLLFLQVFSNGFKVAFFEVLDDVTPAQR
mmetsp:Transcript_25561/g.52447  ORF Transcript_25561/g.52447 Transcript_25561/m.52447 type:complete len:304 (-) Transcript_25561:755-1666(-)